MSSHLRCSSTSSRRRRSRHVELDEQRHALLGRQIQVRRDDVGQARRIAGRRRGSAPVSSGMSGEIAMTLLGGVAHRHRQAVGLGRLRAHFDDGTHIGEEVGRHLREDAEPPPLEPADDHGDARVRELDDLEHLGLDADGVQVFGRRILDLGVLLRRDHHARRLALDHVVDQLERAGATDVDGQHHAGKQDQVAQRQHGQRLHGRFGDVAHSQ